MITIFPLFEWVLGTNHPNTLKGRMAEAIPLYRGALADCERVRGTDHPETLTTRNNLAMAYRAAGRTAEAIPLLERTLADRERMRGADHPDTKAAREDLAALTGEPKRHRRVRSRLLCRLTGEPERPRDTARPCWMSSSRTAVRQPPVRQQVLVSVKCRTGNATGPASTQRNCSMASLRGVLVADRNLHNGKSHSGIRTLRSPSGQHVGTDQR